MNKYPRLFQLLNCDNDYGALFICFDSVEKISNSEVVNAIEKALEDCADEDNPIDAAEEILEKINIERIFVSETATTSVI